MTHPDHAPRAPDPGKERGKKYIASPSSPDPRAEGRGAAERPANGPLGLEQAGLRSYRPKARSSPHPGGPPEAEGGHQPMPHPPAAADPAATTVNNLAMLTPRRAVSYLRVSTARQARRGGGDVEGFSIPAQREANRNKAASMGAIVVKEFKDGGESGTSTVKRNDLNAMLEYLDEHEIDFVIVHKLDRLARNRGDDADITRALQGRKVRLVSTTEPIDETPAGMLLHGILASMNEFYSRNLSIEVLKGMTMKARSGGTTSRAPLGYKNVQTVDEEGRELRTVILDPDRAEHITWAFREYALGKFSLANIAAQLTARGVRTLATPKIPSKPLKEATLHKILTNPYYKGVITFQGVQYPGRHEPLIDAETFDMVQAVMASRRFGERTKRHEHFLKSTLYCGSCDSRMFVQKTRSASGTIYPYFVCGGRHNKTTDCEMKAVPISKVEDQVEEIYERLLTTLTPRFRAELEDTIRSEFEIERRYSERSRQELDVERRKLEREQERLLQAHYADAVPLALMKTEQDRLDTALRHNATQSARLRDDLEHTENLLHEALDLIDNCARAYKLAEDHVKKLFNQVFFKRILVHDDGTLRAEAQEPFATFTSPATRHNIAKNNLERERRRNAKSGTSPKGRAAKSDSSAPDSRKEPHSPTAELDLRETPTSSMPTATSVEGVALGRVSRKNTLVELRRFELLTSSMRTKRATNCAIAPDVA